MAKRGKYTLHKENPTSFKKGIIPWNKDKGVPHKGDKECPVCHKIFHWEIKPYIKKDGYITYVGKEPKTCSKECRYRSASITGTHHIYRNCVVCKKEFHFPPSIAISRKTIYCSFVCRFKNNQMKYSEKEKQTARNKMTYAIKTGILKQVPCVKCGIRKVEGHHYKGYNPEYWLDVIWLCHLHHIQEHERLRQEGLNPTL